MRPTPSSVRHLSRLTKRDDFKEGRTLDNPESPFDWKCLQRMCNVGWRERSPIVSVNELLRLGRPVKRVPVR